MMSTLKEKFDGAYKLGNCITLLPAIRAMRVHALLPDRPSMLDWDSMRGKSHRVTAGLLPHVLLTISVGEGAIFAWVCT